MSPCSRLYVKAGVKIENITMCDSKGVISKSRTDLNKYKLEFAADTDKKTLADAIAGADVFVGLSVKDALTKDMVKTMKYLKEIHPGISLEVRGQPFLST